MLSWLTGKIAAWCLGAAFLLALGFGIRWQAKAEQRHEYAILEAERRAAIAGEVRRGEILSANAEEKYNEKIKQNRAGAVRLDAIADRLYNTGQIIQQPASGDNALQSPASVTDTARAPEFKYFD